MKSFTNFLILICLVTITTFTSCTNKKSEANKLTEEKTTLHISKTDTLIENNVFFQLPSLQKLVEESPILKKEAFESEIKYIVGDAIILSADKKIAYLNLLPKTSEDDNYYIHLVIQNWDNDSPKIAKKWTINNQSGDMIILSDFYENYKDEISELFKNEGIVLLNQKPSFKSYNQVSNINIKSTYKNANDEFKELSKIEIDSKNTTSILLQQDSKKSFCVECDSLLVYKTDFLGELFFEKQGKKILLLGFLEQINQSPSALHLRLVGLRK
ncbi:hypothetical protein [Chryseobacterium balustinum]|uniref:hypothetical protein n=1 Tax=Chryseobacterium balustinum TaxID=246 RepID=UPI003CF474CC